MPVDRDKSLHQMADDQYIRYSTTSFATGGTRSGGVTLDGRAPIGLIMPSSWINTQSTLLRIQVSTGGTTYFPMWAQNTAYTVGVRKSQYVQVDPNDFHGVEWIRLHSTMTRGTAATQHHADVTIISRLL